MDRIREMMYCDEQAIGSKQLKIVGQPLQPQTLCISSLRRKFMLQD
jgi:hypothetical protein